MHTRLSPMAPTTSWKCRLVMVCSFIFESIDIRIKRNTISTLCMRWFDIMWPHVYSPKVKISNLDHSTKTHFLFSPFRWTVELFQLLNRDTIEKVRPDFLCFFTFHELLHYENHCSRDTINTDCTKLSIRCKASKDSYRVQLVHWSTITVRGEKAIIRSQ